MKNAHKFPTVFQRMGIDLRELGCLMIDTENPVASTVGGMAYVSPDPKKFWVKGFLNDWHATVRYGFLQGVKRIDIDEVLADIELPRSLNLSGTEVFDSPYPGEDYKCLVARVEDDVLTKMNTMLSVMPNVNTFPEFKAHITIGYFTKVPEVTLKDRVEVSGLNYGQMLA